MSMRALIAAAAVTVMIGVSLVGVAGRPPGNIDDAFILMVYVRHLSESGGFFWNVEDGAVDGFTSVLDLLAKTVASKLFPGDTFRVMWGTTLAFHALSILLICACALHLRTFLTGVWQRRLVFAFPVAWALHPSLAEGTAYVLETPLYASCLIASTMLALFAPPRSPSIWLVSTGWILLSLARPEGIVIVPVLAAGYAAIHFRTASWHFITKPLGLWLTAMGGYFVWHWLTFGYWAPNTYYAKRSDTRLTEVIDGLSYVYAFAEKPEGVILLLSGLVAPVLYTFCPTRSALWRWRLLTSTCATWAALLAVIAGGGDCYAGSRFLTGLAALIVVTLLVASTALKKPWNSIPLALGVVLAIASSHAYGERARKSAYHARHEWPLSSQAESFACKRQVAEWFLKTGFRQVGESDFQMLKVFADNLQVKDLHGLSDRHIAHIPWPQQNLWGKFNFKSTVELDLEAVVLGFRLFSSVDPTGMTLEEFRASPEAQIAIIGFEQMDRRVEIDAFVKRYRLARVPICEGFNFFVRDDRVHLASAGGAKIGP